MSHSPSCVICMESVANNDIVCTGLGRSSAHLFPAEKQNDRSSVSVCVQLVFCAKLPFVFTGLAEAKKAVTGAEQCLLLTVNA